VIKVPSWQSAEKFVQQPLSFHIRDLFIDVKNFFECDEQVRNNAAERLQAAMLEPDPLGSIASWYAFSTIVNERLGIAIENICIKLYSKGFSKVVLEFSNFHLRTTNALWQEMRDLTSCVDNSPNGLLSTRFKLITFNCSLLLHTEEEKNQDSNTAAFKILEDHPVAVHFTMFAHRQTKADNWQTMSNVVDINFGNFNFDCDIENLSRIYGIYSMFQQWTTAASASASATNTATTPNITIGTSNELQALVDLKSLLLNQTSPNDVASKKNPLPPTDLDDTSLMQQTFALQLTFRGSLNASIHYMASRLQLEIEHVVMNWIFHYDGVKEVQLTFNECQLKCKDKSIFVMKPDRDIMVFKQMRDDSFFIKCHLQTIKCCLENEFASIVNEMYHAFNEKKLANVIKCGLCQTEILLDDMDKHVCRGSAHFSTNRSTNYLMLDSTSMPKLCFVLQMDHIEARVDSSLFNGISHLLHASTMVSGGGGGGGNSVEKTERKMTLNLTDLNLTTESNEFTGSFIFVPVLPLAFQMLECTIKGCGCCCERTKEQQQQQQQQQTKATSSSSKANAGRTNSRSCSRTAALRSKHHLPKWPRYFFLQLKHFSITSTDVQNQLESIFLTENIRLHSSFSDGTAICGTSHPQLSLCLEADRLRMHLDKYVYEFLQRQFKALLVESFGATTSTTGLQKQGQSSALMQTQTLFMWVMQLQTIEMALLSISEVGNSIQNLNKSNVPLKSHWKKVNFVVDNQMGHLSVQTNMDWKAFFTSNFITFEHFTTLENEDTEEKKKRLEAKERILQARQVRQSAEQQEAVLKIQCLWRGALIRIKHPTKKSLIPKMMKETSRKKTKMAKRTIKKKVSKLKRQVTTEQPPSFHQEAEQLPAVIPLLIPSEICSVSTTTNLENMDPFADETQSSNITTIAQTDFVSTNDLDVNLLVEAAEPAPVVATPPVITDMDLDAMLEISIPSVIINHSASNHSRAGSMDQQYMEIFGTYLPAPVIPTTQDESQGRRSLTTSSKSQHDMADQVSSAIGMFGSGLKKFVKKDIHHLTSATMSLTSATVNLTQSTASQLTKQLHATQLTKQLNPNQLSKAMQFPKKLVKEAIAVGDSISKEFIDAISTGDVIVVDKDVEVRSAVLEGTTNHFVELYDKTHQTNRGTISTKSSQKQATDKNNDTNDDEFYHHSIDRQLSVGSDPNRKSSFGTTDHSRIHQIQNEDEEVEEFEEEEGELIEEVAKESEEEEEDEEPESVKLEEEAPEITCYEPEFGLTPEQLATLPSLIRVLVQVNENRLCVPINPREKVRFLSQDIVRRFNELFAANAPSSISQVTLQDSRGAIFCPTDIIANIYSDGDIIFAYPHGMNEKGKSHPRLDSTNQSTQVSRKPPSQKKKTVHRIAKHMLKCSKLPLPLVVALLANEKEQDLLQSVSSEGGKPDEWPELVLNSTFLKPSDMLTVEVAWNRSKSIEVTNIDAFVLCLQQLGLCTNSSRRFIGRILRDRLKVLGINPFIQSAAKRSIEFVSDNGSCSNVDYNHLKEMVKETYDIYLK
jgi:hypothetical protein